MASSVIELVPSFVVNDLLASGLVPEDVRARLAGPNEKEATNTPAGVDAYVLPYFDLEERPLPFYRTKQMNNPDPKIKYKQLATGENHVYFPLGLGRLLRNAKYLLITEGEKKAAAAVKAGFPCVALGGVDSWKNRTVVLHKDSKVGTNKNGQIVAKIPAGADITEGVDSLAKGMSEVIGLLRRKDIPIIICYDSDIHLKGLVKYEVQRAAASLGFELRNRGIPFANIKQLILEPDGVDVDSEGLTKLGLDDFLQHGELGSDALEEQIDKCMRNRAAFPKHPNPREFVNRKLQRGQLPRSEMQALTTAIICDLDSHGLRLYCPDDDGMYYFDERTYQLLKVRFTHHMEFSQTPFGQKLYNDYGLSSADLKLLTVLNAQFCGEQPIQKVKPERVMTVRGDCLYYQISDGLMVKVNKAEMKIVNNGADDVLFEGGMVSPIPHTQLIERVKALKTQTLTNQWYEVLKDARIKDSTNDYQRRLLSYLYYISPWFYRWRGTQLPIEQMLGEAGSGKSTLYALRQLIITGIPVLRNAPNDIRDWTASVAATGALHVTDNVHMTSSKLKQELSDELCRVITENDPHIERRKLYSDNDLIRVPVKAVFAVTAIKQPFTNTDIIQRSIITELDKGTDEVIYDGDWADDQLNRFGGRIGWVAHQIVFMHRFFKLIDQKWQSSHRAKFRLINVEQLLHMTAALLEPDADCTWVAPFLETSRDERTAKTDMALEGLILWAEAARREHGKRIPGILFTARDMVNWFEAAEGYEKNPILMNARSLGHYMEEKKNTIANIAGVVPTGFKRNNVWTYRVSYIPNLEQD